MNYLILVVVGLFSGITSGLFGVGGGVIMVPCMVLLLGTDMKRAVGTSLAVIIPTAIVTTIKHYKNGNVDWAMSAALAPSAVIGGFAGVWMTTFIKSADLKRAFGLFIAAVGVYIFFSDRLPSRGRPVVGAPVPTATPAAK